MLPQYRHIGNLSQHRDAERLSYRAPCGNGKMNGSGSLHLGAFRQAGKMVAFKACPDTSPDSPSA
jgi:hypothetical protein